MNATRNFTIIMLGLGVFILLITLSSGAFFFINRNADNSSVAMKRFATLDAEAMNSIEMFGTQTAEAMNAEFSTPDPNSMVSIEIYGTQTAVAELIPTATLLPDQKYWSPPTDVHFSPRFTYSATRWARTDVRTLASLQVSGCMLRVAGGHALGPGWTTEESSLQVGHLTFITILAIDETVPQFITYSLNNGAVFEISAIADFKQCLQDGETVLKTMQVQ